MKSFKTVNDEIFGPVRVFDYDTNLKKSIPVDVRKRMCKYPFTTLQISNWGAAHVCCAEWSQYSVGNIFQESILDIWNGPKIQAFRDSMLDGSYKYCSVNCPHLMSDNSHSFQPKESLLEQMDKDRIYELIFAVDNSCNLHCPSCRNENISTLDSIRYEKLLKTTTNILDQLFSNPHDKKTIINFDSAGELFHSKMWRTLIDTHPLFVNKELWPNVEFLLTTNGVMLTPKIQKKYNKILNDTLQIRISVDAGNKEAYEKVRPPAKWERLLENLDYLYENYLQNKTMKHGWAWNIILQKDNYQSIPDMIRLAETRYSDELPQLWITNILQWPHLNNDLYSDMAVWDSKHPEYNKLIETMNSDVVLNYTGYINNYFRKDK